MFVAPKAFPNFHNSENRLAEQMVECFPTMEHARINGMPKTR